MSVTVGIATLGDDPGRLLRAVDSAIRSAAPLGAGAEVLVVVNGRGRMPELHAVSSPLLRVRYLDRPNVGMARNAVLDEARNDTILFTDDDCLVPEQWCTQMATALHEPGTAAVGAPVRLVVRGPVSAFCDYVRIYDAIQSDGPLLLVTANCGLRRDVIGPSIRFDTCMSGAGAEDTGLALALAKAGLRARWLAGATPVRHGFSERIEEITGRYRQYASNGVHHYLDHGVTEMYVPGMLDHLRGRVQETSAFDRRFGELVEPVARIAFSVYDALGFATSAIGYLDALGTALGTPSLDLDVDALDAEWREIAERVAALAASLPAAEWASLRVDYPGLPQRVATVDPLVARVWETVRRHARARDPQPGGAAPTDHDAGAAEASLASLARFGELRRAFEHACATSRVTTESLDALARRKGMSLRVALETIELAYRIDVDNMVQQWRSRNGRRPGARPAEAAA